MQPAFASTVARRFITILALAALPCMPSYAGSTSTRPLKSEVNENSSRLNSDNYAFLLSWSAADGVLQSSRLELTPADRARLSLETLECSFARKDSLGTMTLDADSVGTDGSEGFALSMAVYGAGPVPVARGRQTSGSLSDVSLSMTGNRNLSFTLESARLTKFNGGNLSGLQKISILNVYAEPDARTGIISCGWRAYE